MKKLLVLLLFILSIPAVFAQEKVTVRGTFRGAPEDDRLYLRRADISELEINPAMIIPVTDGKFQFEMEAGDTLLWYLLIYEQLVQGYSNYARFYPDAPVVTVDIFPQEGAMGRYLHIARGGRYNTSMMEYVAEFASFRGGGYAKMGFSGDYSEAYMWKYAYLKENPIPHGLFLMYEDARAHFFDKDPRAIEEVLEVLAGRYPRHPYVRMIREQLGGESVAK